jgi:hypothetical protein
MTTRSISRWVSIRLVAVILGLATLGISTEAKASYITPNPGLPPQGGVYPPGYFALTPVVYVLPGPTTLELFNILHFGFVDIVVTTVGNNEFETFNSTLAGSFSVNGSTPLPFTLTGSVEVEAFGKAGMTTGTFATQMLSLDMTGTILGNSVTVMLNPASPTVGSTTITEMSSGPPPMYNITSFFDVFTEISLNGGTFVPSTNPETVVLGSIPEPSSWILLGMAGLIVPAYARWGRRRA